MIRLFILIAASIRLAHADYNCSAGCSLNAFLMGPQVCGADGLTYANECFSYCQGIELDSLGPCENLLEESAFVVNSEVIDGATIARFEDEDFRFVTKRTQFATKLENMENMPASDELEVDEMGHDLHFVRRTSEGYEYASRYTLLNETTGPTNLFKGLAEGYEFIVKNRNLIVIGNDTRSAVSDTTIFPFRAIGAADYSWGNNSCTVTMISRKSALTAAHCVWNFVEGKPMPMTRIAPGRYFDSENNTQKEPFGMWEVEYTTEFGAYRETKSRRFDMAVVTYKPINRPDLGCSEVYPGDIVGYVSIDSVIGTETSVTDPRIADVTITGYPYDFRRGEMTSSGPCSPSARSNGAYFLRYFCDTAGGMSGSALLTSENIALGNHVGGSSGANVGPVMSKDMFDAVYTWAGLANQTQLNCRPPATAPQSDCPCPGGGNPWNQILCWFLNIQGCLRLGKLNAV